MAVEIPKSAACSFASPSPCPRHIPPLVSGAVDAKTIVVLDGDETGQELLAEAVRVLRAAGLKVLDTVVHLPSTSFKALELVLPCEGTLALDIGVKTKGKDAIGVFMVGPDQLAKMKAQPAQQGKTDEQWKQYIDTSDQLAKTYLSYAQSLKR